MIEPCRPSRDCGTGTVVQEWCACSRRRCSGKSFCAARADLVRVRPFLAHVGMFEDLPPHPPPPPSTHTLTYALTHTLTFTHTAPSPLLLPSPHHLLTRSTTDTPTRPPTHPPTHPTNQSPSHPTVRVAIFSQTFVSG